LNSAASRPTFSSPTPTSRPPSTALSSACSSIKAEVCSAGSRILVQKSIYKNFVEAMTEKAKKIKLGPPLDREPRWARSSAKNNTAAANSFAFFPISI